MFHNPTKVQGDFRWEKDFGGPVEFTPNPLGKCFLSIRLKPGEKNKRYWDSKMMSWVPGNKNKFILGIDPFKHNTTKDSRRSEGGGAIYYKHDSSIDPNPDEVKHSARFVCTYSNRTYDKEEFFVDMLMMAIHFGAGIFPEINIPEIWEWFDLKGYGAYLIYRWDYATGKQSITPGASFANNQYKDEMFVEYSTQAVRHINIEVHDELWDQAKRISGPKETHKWDLFTAGGWALIGAKQFAEEIHKFDDKKEDLSNYFHTYGYKR
jgi:hypothetical protein